MNQKLLDALKARFGDQVRRREIIKTAEELSVDYTWLLRRRDILCGRGTFNLAKLGTFNSCEVDEAPAEVELTTEEIEEKIKNKFDALRLMSQGIATGQTRCMIVSGPAGLGKSYEVVKAIKDARPDFDEQANKVSGFVRPTGLYKTLFEHSRRDQILLFDDADSIFHDDASLNLLKAACDTTKKRYISWRAETHMKDELGEALPTSFEFEGNIAFITNYDFHQILKRGGRNAEHFGAMISRAHYIDLDLKTKMDYLIRIRMVMRECLASNNTAELGVSTPDECNELFGFLKDNVHKTKDLSLRKVIKLAQLKKIAPHDWQRLAKTID